MRRRDQPPAEWDGGEWVDVGPDGRWRPSAGERFRALVALALLFGALGALAAVASVGADDDGGEDVAAGSTTTASITTTEPTTTVPIDPTSVGGEPPPDQCVFDDRDAEPLRAVGLLEVRVLNGTPRGGHAAAVSDELEDAGYRMLEPANADLRPVTRIDFQPGYCAEAVAMVEVLAVPGTELGVVEPGSDLATETPRVDITVTLGRDSLDR